MMEEQAHDILQILEAELDDIDDSRDDDALFETLFPSQLEQGERKSYSDAAEGEDSAALIDEEIRNILNSSAQLVLLNSVDIPVSELREDVAAETSMDGTDIFHIESKIPENSGTLDINVEVADINESDERHAGLASLHLLTDEERVIITELMELILDAVEQCAPVHPAHANRSELEPPTEDKISAESLKLASELRIIESDEDLVADLKLDVRDPELYLDSSLSVLSYALQQVSQSATAEQNQQEQDDVMWAETKSMKEALERDRIEREARKKRREQQMFEAIRERKIIIVQSIARAHIARKLYRVLLAEVKEQKQQQAAAALVKAQMEEQRRRDNERQMEAVELQMMIKEEAHCATTWALLRQIERQRLDSEMTSMREEDRLSNMFRCMWKEALIMQQTKERLQILQHEEEEYPDISYESEEDSIESMDYRDSECIKDDNDAAKGSDPEIMVIQEAEDTNSRWVRGKLPIFSPHDGCERVVETNLPSCPRAPWGGSIDLSTTDAPAALTERQHLQDTWNRQAAESLRYQELRNDVNLVCTEVPDTLNWLVDEEIQRQCESSPSSPGACQAYRCSTPPLIHAFLSWCQYWERRFEYSNDASAINDNNDVETAATPIMGAAIDSSSAVPEITVQEVTYSGPHDLSADPSTVKELDFCVEDIDNVSFLSKYTGVEKLVLNVNKICNFDGLDNLQQLVHLSAKDNRITDISRLQMFANLRYLYLDSNRISDISCLASTAKNLRVFSLNTNHLSHLPRFNNQSLQRLELFRNRLTSLPKHCLDGAADSLTHLDLGGNQLQSVSGNVLSVCGCLQTIILSQNELTTVPTPLRLPMLKSLWLAGNKITNLHPWSNNRQNEDVMMWPFFAPMLQKLYLRDNRISKLDADVFDQLPLLSELDVSFNVIAKRQELLHLRSCRLLSTLHIQDNPITTARASNNGTVALPEAQQRLLNEWLLTFYPNLSCVSTNQLDAALCAARQQENQLDQLLSSRLYSDSWLSPEDIQDISAAVYLPWEHDPRFVNMIQLLRLFVMKQSSAISKAKVVKRELSKKTKVATSFSFEQQRMRAALEEVDWEINFVNILRQQLSAMKQLAGVDHAAWEDVVICYRCDQVDAQVCTYDSNDLIQQELIDEEIKFCKVDDVWANFPSDADADDGLFTPSLSDPVQQHRNIAAAVQIQRHIRGYHIRRRLKSALLSIKYHDSELDEILGDGEFSLDEDGLLDLNYDWADGELDDEGRIFASSLHKSDIKMRADETLSADDLPSGSTMVYGDHIRRRRGSRQDVASGESALAWAAPPDESSPPKLSTEHAAGGGNIHGPSGPSNANPKSQSDVLKSYEGVTTRYDSTSSSGFNTPSSAASSIDGRLSAREHAQTVAAREWGINDPKTLAAMMKRNKRMKGFMAANAVRAQDKNPQVRLERFLRNAHRPTGGAVSNHANTNTTGAFGGKPQTFRRGAAQSKKKALSVPAWMIGQDAED